MALLSPPTIGPGPLSPRDAAELSRALKDMYRLMGNLSVSPPLQLSMGSAGSVLSLNGDGFMSSTEALEDKTSESGYDHPNTTVQTFYAPDFLLSNSFGDVSIFKKNLFCMGALFPATQSIANNTTTLLTWSPFLDFSGFNVNSTDFTFPVEGLYFIRLQVYWEANATGDRVCQIKLTNVIAGNTNLAVGNGFAHQHECSAFISTAAGGTLQAQVYQDSGGASMCPRRGRMNSTPT